MATPDAKTLSAYDPDGLAIQIFDALEYMECASNARPKCDRYRHRTGLLCAPEFRGSHHSRVEVTITDWLAELFPNADRQDSTPVRGARPDVVFHYADADVILEAKPVWHCWITTGEQRYSGVVTDEFGRSVGNYAGNNIRQVVSDRDKLVEKYRGDRHRHMLLAIVFQRPYELNDRLREAVGSGWSVRTRHIVDQCNPPGDNIGVTAMLFWPEMAKVTSFRTTSNDS